MESQFSDRGAASAYGSGGATGHFDPVSFVKKPQVILRLLSSLFSIIVFGCIFSQGDEKGKCYFKQVSSACYYGEAVGIMALIFLVVFLALDAIFDNISNANTRKLIVLADIAVSGLMSFLWFVCFCYLTSLWSSSDHNIDSKSAMEAVLAFSFFSTGTFIAITVLAVLRYRQGIGSQAASAYDQNTFSQPGDPSPF